MALSFDAATTGSITVASSSGSFSHTCSGINRILFVGVSVSGANGISSVTYNGVSMTLVASIANGTNGEASIWYLISPTSGSNSVSVTASGTTGGAVIGAVSLNGSHQSSPIGATNTATGTSTNPSTSVTTAEDNDWIIDCLFATGAFLTLTPSETQRWNSPTTTCAGGGSTYGPKSPAGSKSMAWTISSSVAWAHVVVAVKEGQFTSLSQPLSLLGIGG